MFLTIKPYLHLYLAELLRLDELFEMELFSTLKLYLHLTELLHITAWIVWNGNVCEN